MPSPAGSCNPDTPLRVVDEDDATRGSISRADVIDALFEDRSARD